MWSVGPRPEGLVNEAHPVARKKPICLRDRPQGVVRGYNNEWNAPVEGSQASVIVERWQPIERQRHEDNGGQYCHPQG
jgi:hypothetical protein